MPVKKSNVDEDVRKSVVESLSREELLEMLGNKGYSDLSIPQPDKDGTVPEFVNISHKIHKMCVPNNPNATITVQKMGILKGAQWREIYAKPTMKNAHPPFVERVRGKNGEYDKKYLMTEDQVVQQIKRIKRNAGRVRHLVDNQVLVWDEQEDKLKVVFDQRERRFIDERKKDDRSGVLIAENDQLRYIEEHRNPDDPYNTAITNKKFNDLYGR